MCAKKKKDGPKTSTDLVDVHNYGSQKTTFHCIHETASTLWSNLWNHKKAYVASVVQNNFVRWRQTNSSVQRTVLMCQSSFN